jgi:hypothetical protein
MAINAGIYHLIGHTSTRRTRVTSRPAKPSLDVNPIEQVWRFMKNKLCWINLKNLGELREKVDQIARLFNEKLES